MVHQFPVNYLEEAEVGPILGAPSQIICWRPVKVIVSWCLTQNRIWPQRHMLSPLVRSDWWCLTFLFPPLRKCWFLGFWWSQNPRGRGSTESFVCVGQRIWRVWWRTSRWDSSLKAFPWTSSCGPGSGCCASEREEQASLCSPGKKIFNIFRFSSEKNYHLNILKEQLNVKIPATRQKPETWNQKMKHFTGR